MAVTTVYTYPLTGSAKDFSIPFEYLARRFVTVTLIGTDRKELVLTTDFRFTSKTSIQTTKAWGAVDGYELIELRRNTSSTDRLVDFADGSILRAYELNIAQIQTMHIAEEARNMVVDTIGTNNAGDLDARGRKIVNLADASEPGDAVTLRQQQVLDTSALNQANRSKTEADRSKAQADISTSKASAASTSQTAAKTSETNAATSATNAATSATNAASSKTAAATSQTAAKTSETNAAASATNAKTSETNAAASEQAAAGYAAGMNMPSGNGQGGKLLRQRPNETGLEYVLSHFAYGLGTLPGVSPTDLNDLNHGVNRIAAYPIGAANAPSVGRGPVLNMGWSEAERVQIAADPARDAVYFRSRYSGTPGVWKAWNEALHTGNVPGLPLDPTMRVAPVALSSSAGDWNTLVNPGWAANIMSMSGANSPKSTDGYVGTGYWYVLVLQYAGANVTQVAFPYGTVTTTGSIFWRSRYQGTWGPWTTHAERKERSLSRQLLWSGSLASGALTSQPIVPGDMIQAQVNNSSVTSATVLTGLYGVSHDCTWAQTGYVSFTQSSSGQLSWSTLSGYTTTAIWRLRVEA